MDTFVYMLLAASLIPLSVNSRCSNLNEVERCNDAGICFCRPCKTCPSGYGLNILCWGRLNKGTVMRCVPCIEGKTYSNHNSTSRCQLCAHCDGKKVLQTCNTTTPTTCSPNQCELGYEYNDIVDSCEPVPTAKPTVQRLTTTHQSSRTPQPTQSSTDPVNGIPTTSYPTSLGTLQDIQDTTKDKVQKDSHVDHTKPKFEYAIWSILSILLVATIATGLYCARKKIRSYLKSKCGSVEDEGVEMEEREPLKSGQDSPPTPHQQVWPWLATLYLKDVPYELLCGIQTNICKQSATDKGWKSIGSKIVNIDKEMLKTIDNCKEEEKAEKFLEVLSSNQPKFTLTNFVDVLRKLGREDVIESICDYYCKHNTAVTHSQECFTLY